MKKGKFYSLGMLAIVLPVTFIFAENPAPFPQMTVGQFFTELENRPWGEKFKLEGQKIDLSGFVSHASTGGDYGSFILLYERFTNIDGRMYPDGRHVNCYFTFTEKQQFEKFKKNAKPLQRLTVSGVVSGSSLKDCSIP
jgi:hypothetical protein